MGIEGTLIVIVIFIIAVAYFGSQISTGYSGFNDWLNQILKNNTLKPHGWNAGDTTCDLKITTVSNYYPGKDSDPINVIAQTAQDQVREFHQNWFNCIYHQSAGASLIPETVTPTPLDVILFAQDHPVFLRVIKTGTGQEYNYNTNPDLKQSIHIPQGITINQPYTETNVFTLSQIVRADYTVKLSTDSSVQDCTQPSYLTGLGGSCTGPKASVNGEITFTVTAK